jgi:hypothetical protein
LVSSGPGRTSPFLAIENSTSFIHVHTGVFPSAEEMVNKKHPVEQVQTGEFETPQGFIGKAQGFSLAARGKSPPNEDSGAGLFLSAQVR